NNLDGRDGVIRRIEPLRRRRDRVVVEAVADDPALGDGEAEAVFRLADQLLVGGVDDAVAAPLELSVAHRSASRMASSGRAAWREAARRADAERTGRSCCGSCSSGSPG